MFLKSQTGFKKVFLKKPWYRPSCETKTLEKKKLKICYLLIKVENLLHQILSRTLSKSTVNENNYSRLVAFTTSCHLLLAKLQWSSNYKGFIPHKFYLNFTFIYIISWKSFEVFKKFLRTVFLKFLDKLDVNIRKGGKEKRDDNLDKRDLRNR